MDTSTIDFADYRLDHKSPLPLHAQAEQVLLKVIRHPERLPKGLLPEEVSLARAMGVSRNTLRAAIGRLVDRGLLERKSGVGTRVCEPKVYSGVGAWQSFTKEMQAKGVAVSDLFTKASLQALPEPIALALRAEAGKMAPCIERVRGWDAKPEIHSVSWFPPALKDMRLFDFKSPLYEWLRARYGRVADQSREELTAIAANRKLARLLAVKPGTPLLARERVVLDAAGNPIEYSLVHYRCDRFRLTVNLRQE